MNMSPSWIWTKEKPFQDMYADFYTEFEFKNADIGVAGGINEALLFKKGEIIRKIKEEDILKILKEEILNF